MTVLSSMALDEGGRSHDCSGRLLVAPSVVNRMGQFSACPPGGSTSGFGSGCV